MINLKEIKDLQKQGEFKKAKKLYLEILKKDTNNFLHTSIALEKSFFLK